MCWGTGTGTSFTQGDSRLQHPLAVAGETKIPTWDPPAKPTAPREGWGALVGWGAAASGAKGTEQLQPLSAGYEPAMTQLQPIVVLFQNRTDLLFPKSHRTRGYTVIKWSFSYCCSESPGSAQKFITQTQSGKTLFKTQNSPIGLSFPYSHPSSSDPCQTNPLLALGSSSSRALGPSGTAGKWFFFSTMS